MSTCVATGNPDDITMIPFRFITFLLFPYLTLQTQILSMSQSFKSQLICFVKLCHYRRC